MVAGDERQVAEQERGVALFAVGDRQRAPSQGGARGEPRRSGAQLDRRRRGLQGRDGEKRELYRHVQPACRQHLDPVHPAAEVLRHDDELGGHAAGDLPWGGREGHPRQPGVRPQEQGCLEGVDMSTTAAPEQKKPQVRAVSPRRRALRPYLLVLPSLLLTIGILYPFGLGLFYTFFNYVAIFTSSEFWQSAWVTLRYAVSTTVVETLLGVGVALLLFRGSVSGRILERVLIVPLMIAPVIATIMWSLMLQPTVGVINYMLSPLGLGGVEWTDSPRGAFLSAVVIDAWIFTPFVALLALAGMRSLPRDPFEAAAVDGAGYWYTFRKLMLPMLWPYILVAVIFRFMDSLKMFDVIYALTRGGPGDSMMVLQVRGYQEAILYTNFSVGLTYTIVIWAAVFIATRLLVGVFGRAQARAAGP